MKKFLFTIQLLCMATLSAQSVPFIPELYNSYENYREKEITARVFTPEKFHTLLLKKTSEPLYSVHQAGSSVLGKPIYLVKAGTGKTVVFLWSQMHGDEPTATQALLDFFNFLNDTTAFRDIRNLILTNVTIYIMPMVNPDGATAVTRRNAQEIDINRDVIRLVTPEGRLLLETFNRLKPDYGFNLHDQNPRYSVGETPLTAGISFLAPAPNVSKDIPENRARAMRLIGIMAGELNKYMQGHIARYDDEYEPRAYGDKFQALGAATILIESGGWEGDPEKQFLRKMNFLSFVTALWSVAAGTVENASIQQYEQLPFNHKNHFDLLIRNVLVKREDSLIPADIAINRNERVNNAKTGYLCTGVIEDFGHLLGFYGIEDFDGTGLTAEPGKIYRIKSAAELTSLKTEELYRKGITTIETEGEVPPVPDDYPFTVRAIGTAGESREIHIGRTADFTLTRNGSVEYTVVNGILRKVK